MCVNSSQCLRDVYTCIHSFPGIPVIFVAVGLGSVRDEYGVRADDESDDYYK